MEITLTLNSMCLIRKLRRFLKKESYFKLMNIIDIQYQESILRTVTYVMYSVMHNLYFLAVSHFHNTRYIVSMITAIDIE